VDFRKSRLRDALMVLFLYIGLLGCFDTAEKVSQNASQNTKRKGRFLFSTDAASKKMQKTTHSRGWLGEIGGINGEPDLCSSELTRANKSRDS